MTDLLISHMDACPRYLCTCVYVIVCMSARKKAPVNLLMCPFELYMFIGVSMQLRVVFKYDFLVLIPYCWSVALEKKKKKKKKGVSSILSASCQQVKAGVSKGGESVWGLSPELLCWGGVAFGVSMAKGF